MTKSHSPFHVVEDFLSPAFCEHVIKEYGIAVPSLDDKEKPIKNERFTDIEILATVQDGLYEHLADIQGRYKGLAKEMGDKTPIFRQYFENPKDAAEPHGCEAFTYFRKKWIQSKDVHLVGFIWLKDYGNGVPLDPRFEVYGGKLEFPGYDFSLIPQRGTLVLFPADPHFITAISPILVGSLELLKISIKLENADGTHWLYQPANFPGTYHDWFE